MALHCVLSSDRQSEGLASRLSFSRFVCLFGCVQFRSIENTSKGREVVLIDRDRYFGSIFNALMLLLIGGYTLPDSLHEPWPAGIFKEVDLLFALRYCFLEQRFAGIHFRFRVVFFGSSLSPASFRGLSCSFAWPQRAAAAFLARAFRFSGVRFTRLFFPPLRPNATAAGFFLLTAIHSSIYAQRCATIPMHSDGHRQRPKETPECPYKSPRRRSSPSCATTRRQWWPHSNFAGAWKSRKPQWSPVSWRPPSSAYDVPRGCPNR